MNASPPPEADSLDDDRIRAVVTWIARASLEIERGFRPLQQLRRFVHPNDPRHARMIFRLRSDIGGPVTTADLGRPSFSRIGDDHLYASAPTRGSDGRVRGLTMHLFRDDHSWYLADVLRIGNRRDRPTQTSDQPTLARQLDQLDQTRRYVNDARAASTPGPSAPPGFGDQTETFARLAGELDREAATLRRRLELRRQLGGGHGRGR